MKTAMQQLIDIIDKGISILKETQIKERIILEGVKGEAENLIEAERKQMMEVVEFCDAHCNDGHFDKEGAIANIKRNFNLSSKQ